MDGLTDIMVDRARPTTSSLFIAPLFDFRLTIFRAEQDSRCFSGMSLSVACLLVRVNYLPIGMRSFGTRVSI